MSREGSTGVKYCGYRKVKGAENVQAVFSLAAIYGYVSVM